MSEKQEKPTTQSSPYLVPLAIIVAGALVGAGLYFGGKQPQPSPQPAPVQVLEEGKEGEEGQVAGEEEAVKYEKTAGDFLILNEELCQENGKPIVYFFGSSGCSHCKWEHPRVEEVVEKFGDQISFHDLMDKQEEMEVFEKYLEINGGGIPFIVLGCRYARVGSGEQAGEEAEKAALIQLICELTGGQPAEVCK